MSKLKDYADILSHSQEVNKWQHKEEVKSTLSINRIRIVLITLAVYGLVSLIQDLMIVNLI